MHIKYKTTVTIYKVFVIVMLLLQMIYIIRSIYASCVLMGYF